jgi:hypothetical protein
VSCSSLRRGRPMERGSRVAAGRLARGTLARTAAGTCPLSGRGWAAEAASVQLRNTAVQKTVRIRLEAFKWNSSRAEAMAELSLITLLRFEPVIPLVTCREPQARLHVQSSRYASGNLSPVCEIDWSQFPPEHQEAEPHNTREPASRRQHCRSGEE